MTDQINQIIITPEGFELAKKELEDCMNKRRVILERIEAARALGDLKENAEYHEAKESQQQNEMKIAEHEYLLKVCKVVASDTHSNTLNLGNRVVVKTNKGDMKEFKIVGFNEANPSQGLISNESPLGKALIGRQKGESVEVNLPSSVVEYTIVEIK